MLILKNLFIILILVLSSSSNAQNTDLPVTNQRIVDYVESVIGKTVGRGECWDLADAALTVSQARFDKSSDKTIYIFGDPYNPKKTPVLPGDILQFENVIVKYQKDNKIYTENFGHHTAIILDVIGDEYFKLAHQNTGFSGRKVGTSELRLSYVQKGKIKFYRPIPQ